MTLTLKQKNIERTKDMIKVMQAYVDGADIECTCLFSSVPFELPNWQWHDVTYRVVEKTPDSINWDHVAPEYKWMARDEDDKVYMYDEKPRLTESKYWLCFSGTGQFCKLFSSYKRGTCDWKDSLVIRPKCE